MPIDAARVRAVSFDLDGTLIDTLPDLVGAVNDTLVAMNARPLDYAMVAEFVGDGADVLVERALAESLAGSARALGRTVATTAPTASTAAPTSSQTAAPSKEQSEEAQSLFTRIYAGRLFKESRLYPDTLATLRVLTDAGIVVSCITNKSARFAIPLLEVAGLSQWLRFTLCPNSREERKPNPAMLLAACRKSGVAPNEFAYVGDSHTDITAAHAAGCPAIAVTYGYNRKVPLANVRPEATVTSLGQVLACVGLSSSVGLSFGAGASSP